MKDMIVFGLLGMFLGWVVLQGFSAHETSTEQEKYVSKDCILLLMGVEPSGALPERDICFLRSFLDAEDSKQETIVLEKHKSLLDRERSTKLVDLARKCRDTISATVDSVKFRCTESFPTGSALSAGSDCTTPRVFGALESSNPYAFPQKSSTLFSLAYLAIPVDANSENRCTTLYLNRD
jgi:hypothetical protein